MRSKPTVYIGFDPHEVEASLIAYRSAQARTSLDVEYRRLALLELRHQGMYRRPTEIRDGRLWDVISDAPMSTEHAIARFFIPMLCGYQGWAVFMDGDVLVRGDLADLFAQANPVYAVQVVHHRQIEQGGPIKKDGAIQTVYHRKNQSSVMLINCGHPANSALRMDMLNRWPGRDLHAFGWIPEEEIGPLDAGWNYLVGVTDPVPNPVHIAHFTLGLPTISGHEHDPFADEWFAAAKRAGYVHAPVAEVGV